MREESGQDDAALEDDRPPADQEDMPVADFQSREVLGFDYQVEPEQDVEDVQEPEAVQDAEPGRDIVSGPDAEPMQDLGPTQEAGFMQDVEPEPDTESEQDTESGHDTESEHDAESVYDAPTTASALDVEGLPQPDPELQRVLEALLFLSPEPLSTQELADAAAADELAVIAALAGLAERYAPGRSGIHLRELGGGFTFATGPDSEDAARRLFSRPRASVLTPAQAETLAIVAYLQPVSRPEITRIRGVSADSAASTLLERNLIEESGRSQFGAVLYRTTTEFLKLFGLNALDDLPDVAQWDPTPEEQAELRDRLLRAGEARSGGEPPTLGD